MQFTYTRNYGGSIKLAIFDWAGTTVDYGCQAPISAFVEGFRKQGVAVTMTAARIPMGMEKRDHICSVASQPEVARAWQQVHTREISEQDIDNMYRDFTTLLLESIEAKSDMIPGVADTIESLRSQNIRIGASTGYFKEAADIVAKKAAAAGYCPDFTISSSEVPAGRPWPWMIYRVMEKLSVCPPESVINVGDTPVDIETGLNSGVWSVGVAVTGNQMGLSEQECRDLSPEVFESRATAARESLSRAGAHYVIDTLDSLPEVIDEINSRLAVGDKP
ncbi:MAG: phosphonoacetaldehyde hydrolase [Desulfobulbaceae bacterium]|nr:MAG: phosphonoacetaldehyde hydrolase [Desulfobulbaceae bacterium]